MGCSRHSEVTGKGSLPVLVRRDRSWRAAVSVGAAARAGGAVPAAGGGSAWGTQRDGTRGGCSCRSWGLRSPRVPCPGRSLPAALGSHPLQQPLVLRSLSGLVASFLARRQRPESPLVSLIKASQGSVFLPPGVEGLRPVAACGSRSLPSPPRAAPAAPCPTLPPSRCRGFVLPVPSCLAGAVQDSGPCQRRGEVSAPRGLAVLCVCWRRAAGCRPPLPGAGLPQPALVLTHTLFPEPPLPAQQLVNKSPNPPLRGLLGEQSSCSDQFFTFHLLTAARLTVTRSDVPHAARLSLKPFEKPKSCQLAREISGLREPHTARVTLHAPAGNIPPDTPGLAFAIFRNRAAHVASGGLSSLCG